MQREHTTHAYDCYGVWVSVLAPCNTSQQHASACGMASMVNVHATLLPIHLQYLIKKRVDLDAGDKFKVSWSLSCCVDSLDAGLRTVMDS